MEPEPTAQQITLVAKIAQREVWRAPRWITWDDLAQEVWLNLHQRQIEEREDWTTIPEGHLVKSIRTIIGEYIRHVKHYSSRTKTYLTDTHEVTLEAEEEGAAITHVTPERSAIARDYLSALARRCKKDAPILFDQLQGFSREERAQRCGISMDEVHRSTTRIGYHAQQLEKAL